MQRTRDQTVRGRCHDIHKAEAAVGWDLLCSTHIFTCVRLPATKKTKGSAKCKDSRPEPPFGGLKGNAHGSSMARWKARGRFLLVLIELFSLVLTVEALWENIGRNRCVRKGWVTLSANVRGMRVATNDCWRQKTTRGLSRGVVCVILRLAVLTQYRRVTDSQTDGRTHDDS